MITFETVRIRFSKVVAVVVSWAPRSLPLRSDHPPRTQTSLSRWKCTLPMVPCDLSPVARLYLRKNERLRRRLTDHTTPKCGTQPIRYMTLHFRDRRGAASLRCRNRAEIIVLVCAQNMVWFSYRRKSYPVPNPIGLGAGIFSPPNPLHWFFFKFNTQLDFKTVVFFPQNRFDVA